MRIWLRRLAPPRIGLTVYGSLIAIALLIAAPGLAAAGRQPPAHAHAKMAGAHRPRTEARQNQVPLVRVLFVGASITSGMEQSSLDDTYPGDVVARLRERGLRVEWDERARSGAMVGDALTWPYPADQQIIVVHLITNDFLRGTPLDAYQDRLHQVLVALRERSPQAHLVCLGTWEAPGFVNRDQVPLETYDAAAKESCDGEQGTFVPLDGIFATPGTRGPRGQATPWGPTDGWHPNDVGAQDIADAVLAALPDRGSSP